MSNGVVDEEFNINKSNEECEDIEIRELVILDKGL